MLSHSAERNSQVREEKCTNINHYCQSQFGISKSYFQAYYLLSNRTVLSFWTECHKWGPDLNKWRDYTPWGCHGGHLISAMLGVYLAGITYFIANILLAPTQAETCSVDPPHLLQGGQSREGLERERKLVASGDLLQHGPLSCLGTPDSAVPQSLPCCFPPSLVSQFKGRFSRRLPCSSHRGPPAPPPLRVALWSL